MRIIVCKSCTKAKPEDQFNSWKYKGKSHYFYKCKPCVYQRAKERAQTKVLGGMNQKYIDNLWSIWRMTPEDYLAIRRKQDNKCACCGDLLSDNSVQVHLDHWPGTDKCRETVRGIICSGCNRGLGCFNDNVEKLQRAANYLKACYAIQHTSPKGVDILRTSNDITVS